MSDPFLGEIRIVGFNFPPRDWAFCNGQILPIDQNQALFSLLGTTYGGDGRTTFALPDLRGRTPVHPGDDISRGQKTGEEAVALDVSELPSHTHTAQGTAATANTTDATGALLANTARVRRGVTPFGDPNNLGPLNSSSIGSTGNGVPHNNMQPFLALHFIIAIRGLFPPRN